MRSTRNIRWIVLLLALVTLASCSDNASLAPVTTGEIAGSAGYYDGADIRFGNVTVSLEGTSISTVTDSTGRFDLKGVPAGVYDVVFTFPGYASDRVTEFQFVGAGRVHLPSSMLLTRVPDYLTATIDSFRFEEYQVIKYRDTVVEVSGSIEHQLRYDTVLIPQGLLRMWPALHAGDTVTNYQYAVCFFSPTKQIDITDPASYNLTVVGSSNFAPSVREIALETEQLRNAGFRSGQTVYSQAYGGSQSPHYYDYDTRQTVFTGLSPHGSQVVSFVMP